MDRVLEPYHDENGTIREGNAMSQNIRNLDKSIHRDLTRSMRKRTDILKFELHSVSMLRKNSVSSNGKESYSF